MATTTSAGYYTKAFPHSIICSDCAHAELESNEFYHHTDFNKNFVAVLAETVGRICATCRVEVHGA